MADLSCEEYRLLIEQSPNMIWRSGTDKLCNYFNTKWLQFRGRKMEEELGNGWAEGVHPEDFQFCLDTYMQAFDKRVPFEMKYRLKRFDGEYRWILDCGTPFYNDKGEFLGYIGSCLDIDDAVKAEQMLKQKTLEEIERLQKLIPICMYCKKVRIDEVFWKNVEDYLYEHKIAIFTHGICEECRKKVEEEFNKSA
jgi:PAS domain S-box-containing protein